jgi:CDP-diacylglycerol---serine O-phosphatidyltransferase
MFRHLPNAITLVNLACGVLGICAVFLGQVHLLPWLVGLALLADFLDGYLARALKASSELGLQLDSLADLVTFGVLPGMILFYMGTDRLENTQTIAAPGWAYAALLYPVFAAYRLGKFNIDTRQSENFLGMPTPAGGMLVLGLLQSYLQEASSIANWLQCPLNIAKIAVILSVLMITEIPMLSFKLKQLTWKGNEWRWLLAGGMIVTVIVFKSMFFAPAMLWYLLLSLIKAGKEQWSR